MESEARGHLRHRLPRLVERHHPVYELRAEVAMDAPQRNGGGLAVDRDVDVEPHVSGERFCLLALGLLDVLADCAQRHVILLGDLLVGHPVVEVIGHQLLDASPPEPHQEAALLEVCPLLSLPAPSQCSL